MTENTDPKVPIETIPSIEGGISGIGSAHAPFLYFEGAPAFGTVSGIVQITLEAQRIFPTATGAPGIDRVIVAHLRMNIPAALSLRAAIDGALLLAAPSTSDAKN